MPKDFHGLMWSTDIFQPFPCQLCLVRYSHTSMEYTGVCAFPLCKCACSDLFVWLHVCTCVHSAHWKEQCCNNNGDLWFTVSGYQWTVEWYWGQIHRIFQTHSSNFSVVPLIIDVTSNRQVECAPCFASTSVCIQYMLCVVVVVGVSLSECGLL